MKNQIYLSFSEMQPTFNHRLKVVQNFDLTKRLLFYFFFFQIKWSLQTGRLWLTFTPFVSHKHLESKPHLKQKRVTRSKRYSLTLIPIVFFTCSDNPYTPTPILVIPPKPISEWVINYIGVTPRPLWNGIWCRLIFERIAKNTYPPTPTCLNPR